MVPAFAAASGSGRNVKRRGLQYAAFLVFNHPSAEMNSGWRGGNTQYREEDTMPRPQFSLKTLLWMIVCVACFFAGARWNDRRWNRERTRLKEEIKVRTIQARSRQWISARAERLIREEDKRIAEQRAKRLPE